MVFLGLDMVAYLVPGVDYDSNLLIDLTGCIVLALSWLTIGPETPLRYQRDILLEVRESECNVDPV